MIDTKLCTKCEKTKPLAEFAWSSRVKNKRQTYCRECSNAAGKLNYLANKERYFTLAKQRDKEMRDKVRAIKSVPCADCNNSFDWVCMDFDHLPEFTKIYEISYMMRHRMAWNKIEAEIAKCEVVCSNCHRIRSKSRWTTEEKIEGDF